MTKNITKTLMCRDKTEWDAILGRALEQHYTIAEIAAMWAYPVIASSTYSGISPEYWSWPR